MRKTIVMAGIASAFAFTVPTQLASRRTSAPMMMATQKSPTEKTGFESPKAKLNALAANEKQWGINADEAMKAPATASTDVKWLKVEKQWIDRPKPNPDMKWPATVFDKTNKFGPFNGGGWAATKATDMDTISQMKGSAIWLALSILLIQPFTFMGTYQYEPSFAGLREIVTGRPLSMATSKATGEPVDCRATYGLPCWPSGATDRWYGGVSSF